MSDIRKSFHQTLEDIRHDMVQMAAHVTEGIPKATAAMLDGDMDAATVIVEGDDPLDAKALELEELCYQQLALQQPMAGDLRGIVTAIRMIAEIERSGDLVVNIAKGSRRILGTELSARLRGLIADMGEESTRLFRMAIDSYIDEDAGVAAALDDLDDRLDAMHRDYIQEIFLWHNSGALPVQAAVQLALIGRYYERIGDHAVNIGERVRYMVTGWLPEQAGAARAEARGEPTLDGS
ncbi:MAG: phosphate signaling complex protein PhoU [Aquihabitans sp.]